MRPGRLPVTLLRRVCAQLVAAVCVLGLFSTELHHLLVRHATCAEHGELIHTADQSPHKSTLRAQVGAKTAEQRVLPEGDSASHEHEHCGVLSRHARCQTSANRGIAHEPAFWMAASSLGQALPSWQPIDLVLLAPKTSPPV